MAEIGTDISRAGELLRNSGLVAIPTETVYGLAGNAYDEDAVEEIYRVKERPSFDPLICHAASLVQVERFTDAIPSMALKLATAFWPGPMTLILPRNEKIPYLVTSGLDTVGVRIPDHPLTLQLLKSLEFPLAAPSANPFGYVSPTTPQHVEEQLGDKLGYILDGGPSRIGIESTIIGFEEGVPVIYRLGGIPIERITDLVGPVKMQAHSTSDPRAPGMLKTHYSPVKKLILGNIQDNLKDYNTLDVSILSFQTFYPEVPEDHQFILSPDGDLDEAAKNLFKALRLLDKSETKLILAEPMPEEGLGRAINDRLKRASA